MIKLKVALEGRGQRPCNPQPTFSRSMAQCSISSIRPMPFRYPRARLLCKPQGGTKTFKDICGSTVGQTVVCHY
ncbi:hypothetical protein Q1695_010772 [Nippostrongylus brasiliensis]|nr:hypothetical protein Q1695_010772 [Nippostrongylus brasiliensis]